MRFMAFCLLILCSLTCASAEERQAHNAYDRYIKPQTLVKLPDGRKFNMYCTGKGSPTAILDASAARWNTSWRHIQPDFAKLTRVCSVDRAGFGFSDPGSLPRDVAAEESDLHAALAAAGLKPPYILVGHSHGGSVVRLFAYRHPEEVAGLLLIDPGIEHLPHPAGEVERSNAHTRKCAEQARSGKLTPGETLPGEEEPCEFLPGPDWSKAAYGFLTKRFTKPAHFDAILAEEITEDLSAAEIEKARHKLGNVPLVVLSQDEEHYTEDMSHEQYAVWVSAHEDMARDSTRGIHEVVPGTSHYIFSDRPDVVLAKFREILSEASAR